jgi:hypothetical protein
MRWTRCPDTQDGLSVDMARRTDGHTPLYRGCPLSACRRPPTENMEGGGA